MYRRNYFISPMRRRLPRDARMQTRDIPANNAFAGIAAFLLAAIWKTAYGALAAMIPKLQENSQAQAHEPH